MTRFYLTFWAVALLLLTQIRPGCAATYYVSPSGNDNNAGTAGAPYLTIQAAINNAAAGDTLLLEDGSFAGGGNRDLDCHGKNLIFKSRNGAAKTTIDCGGTDTDFHLAFYFHSGESVEIIGITIKNSYNIDDGAAVEVGKDCAVKLVNCVFSTNVNGIKSAGDAILSGCTFTKNSASGVVSVGTVALTRCVLSDNARSGIDVRGEATCKNCAITGNANNGIVNEGTVTLSICTVSGNTGSGVLNEGMATLSGCKITGTAGRGINNHRELVLTACTINDNTATQDGSGIHNEGRMKLTNCTLSHNVVQGIMTDGGGIYNDNNATAYLMNCTLRDNSASEGGGISSHGTAVLANCLLFGNTATSKDSDNSQGGAIFNDGKLTLQYCTLSGNMAQGANAKGGALENDAEAILTNCILWGNTAPYAGEIGNPTSGDPVNTITYCDVQGGYKESGNLKSDPLFVDALHGDLHLRPGSPCIGKGIAIIGISADKDAKARPNHSTLGAYEGVRATPKRE